MKKRHGGEVNIGAVARWVAFLPQLPLFLLITVLTKFFESEIIFKTNYLQD